MQTETLPPTNENKFLDERDDNWEDQPAIGIPKVSPHIPALP